jgi:hypothetical protein
MDGFNSQGWIPFIKALACKFYEKADKQFVLYEESFINSAMTEYSKRLSKLKIEIFGNKCPADKRIDRHKTIALYLQVFIEKPIFRVPDVVKSDFGSWLETKLINEMFCYLFMCVVLEQWNEKRIDHHNIDEYKVSFLKLLYYYRDYSKLYGMKHVRENSELDKRNNFFTYTLAHAVYFVERDFMIERA